MDWQAVVAIVIAVVSWMLTTTAILTVTAYQVQRIITNHLPHLERLVGRLLDGNGRICLEHDRRLGILEGTRRGDCEDDPKGDYGDQGV